MRPSEFDFRLWLGEDYSSDNYKYQDLLTLSNGQKSKYLTRLGLNNFDNRYNIELYTGFKDKNGTKIYEGDIVTYRKEGLSIVEWAESTWYLLNQNISPENRLDCGIRLQVIFNNIKYKSKKDTEILLDCVEILGNIHENAELLE